MTASSAEFRIPCTTIELVERAKPDAVSLGDAAVARLEPGIIRFLETPILGTEILLGAGYHSRFTVPFGVAASAAYAVIAPLQSAAVSWTGFDVDVEWSAAAGLDDVLTARATVTALDDGLALFEFSCRGAGASLLLRGQLRLRALRDGKAISTGLLNRSPKLAQEVKRLAGHALIESVQAPEYLSLGSRGPVVIALANQEMTAKAVCVSLEVPSGGG